MVNCSQKESFRTSIAIMNSISSIDWDEIESFLNRVFYSLNTASISYSSGYHMIGLGSWRSSRILVNWKSPFIKNYAGLVWSLNTSKDFQLLCLNFQSHLNNYKLLFFYNFLKALSIFNDFIEETLLAEQFWISAWDRIKNLPVCFCF